MKNSKYIAQMDEVGFSEDFEQKMIEKAGLQSNKKIHVLPHRYRPAICAAALIVVIAVSVFTLPTVFKGERIKLEKSQGASAWYPNEMNRKFTMATVNGDSAACLIGIPEDDLISLYNETCKWEQALFRGKVTAQRDVVLDVGDITTYESLAEISVTESYCDSVKPGETVEVLMPCQAYREGGERFENTISDIAKQIRIGMEGIFVATVVDDDDCIRVDDKSLYYSDICRFMLGDGIRNLFLDINGELVYERVAYPSFDSAENLDDVERIILQKLGK